MKSLLTAVLLTLGFVCAAEEAQFFAALHLIEAGGKLHPRDGDHGKAIGPFQIHKPYWQDAVEFNPELQKEGYQKCRDYAYAIRVIKAYMQRFDKTAWDHQDWKTLAQIHNGGPKGRQRPAARQYAERVITLMKGYTTKPTATNIQTMTINPFRNPHKTQERPT